MSHVKDSIKDKPKEATGFIQIKVIIDGYIDYYNNGRCRWQLAKLSPNKYYQFCITGEYPLAVANPPSAPIAKKSRRGLKKSMNPTAERKRGQGTPGQPLIE